MAERLALAFLADCCREVRRHHAPGARVILCSDGHVFADQVGVPDADVDAYLAELADLLGPDLALFSLADAYPGLTPAQRRARLLAEHGRPLPALRAEVRAGGPAQRLFNGLDRFMREDRYPRAEAKARAYRVLQRSQAWGELVGRVFPEAVRLSIHPQPAHGEKLGIHLLPTHDDWLTPWHGVAVEGPAGFTLAKRRDVEARGGQLVYLHGRPSHYRICT
jgi:pyoverdine/dityrosine biosynthesis protein Dit1